MFIVIEEEIFGYSWPTHIILIIKEDKIGTNISYYDTHEV